MLSESDLIADDEVAFFRRTNVIITVIEMIVIKRMTTIRTPIETPNTRPLTVNELVAPITAFINTGMLNFLIRSLRTL